MKASSTKGLDPVVAVCPTTCCCKQLLEQQQQVAHAYLRTIEWVRNEYLKMTNKRGPTYMALTMCDNEGEVGLVSSKMTKGKRWACKTCFHFAGPMWTDREDKCPSTEEALIEYGEWISKPTNATKPWRKDINDNDVR